MKKKENNMPSTSQLIQEVGEWAEKNFGTIEMGRRIPHYGLMEEVGEAVHCILKNRQKIRGYEVEEFFRSELKDAFADTIIYLADYTYIHRAYFKFGPAKEESIAWLRSRNEEIIISQVTQCVSSIFNYVSQMNIEEMAGSITVYSMMAQRLCSSIGIWAAYHDFNLEEIVWQTWTKVSRRDWNKDPKGGGE